MLLRAGPRHGTFWHIPACAPRTRARPVLATPDRAEACEQVDRARGVELAWPENLNLDDETMEFATGNESDVTAEDLEALGPKDLSLDMGEDGELLKHRVWPVDMAGKDLDVPGSEGASDSLNQGIGPADEENDYYSLGGDDKEDNMEGK